MKNTQTMQVVMLPTEDASPIVKFIGNIAKGNLVYEPTLADRDKDEQNQNLYVVSNAEIKEGDWQYTKLHGVTNAKNLLWSKQENTRKIEATTDKSLNLICGHCGNVKIGLPTGICGICGKFRTKDLIPQIPQSFIEAYVKAEGKITEINVEIEMLNIDEIRERGKGFLNQDNSKIKTREDGTIIIHPSKAYTREEVKNLCTKALVLQGVFATKEKLINKWIEENL